jgi:lipopolysaccharide transport system ATP-binding protein
MRPIIRAEGVSKQYRIGRNREEFPTLRDALARAARAPLRWAKSAVRPASPTFWALRDVGFEVAPGEVVGIIGRNGAGKSTLLKILSRITEPTEGRIELYGRMSSLLEVGTGFHPELTGRENTFLNGAILGMRRAELARKFDEIVAFAEIEKFIDTPVKHYSSGMYVRLAFAVAAHIDPEILVVDEVLAVGDMAFQQKCLNKMQDAGAQGRTVLFVSHNMAAVTRLCGRAILLSEGAVVRDGPATEAVNVYMGSPEATGAAREWPASEKAPGDDFVRLRAVRVRPGGRATDVADIREPVLVEIEYDILKPGKRLSPCIICNNEEGVCVFTSAGVSREFIENQDVNYVGRCLSTCLIPGNFLAEGALAITASIQAVLDGNVTHAMERDAIRLQVVDSLEEGSARGLYGGPYAGVVRPMLTWTRETTAGAGRG